jgi:hypothetical protein
MRNAILASVLAVGLVSIPLAAAPGPSSVPDQPTFHKDVEPILQDNCQGCHRQKPLNMSGMIAPFPLTTFDEARPWAKAIAKAVESKIMPPWGASEKFHGVFNNERHLEPQEIETIVRWTKTGAVAGDPADAPPPRKFPETEWWLGKPDLIVKLPEPVWVGDDVKDWQPNIFVELTADQLPEDRYLRAIECKPGSDRGVHHVVINTMEPGEGNAVAEAAGRLIGGLAPGDEPGFAQDGYGMILRKGTKLRVNMHYNKEPGPGTGFYDQTEMGFFFYPKDAAVRETITAPISLIDFEIPPGKKEWTVGMAQTFDRPFTLLSMLPHTHVRGVAAEYVAYFPDGTVETLLEVPNYDYNWQITYEYPEPRHFPAGTRIEVKVVYDNSPENPSNPDPTAAVRFGLETQQEMALGWIRWAWDDEVPASATGGGR